MIELILKPFFSRFFILFSVSFITISSFFVLGFPSKKANSIDLILHFFRNSPAISKGFVADEFEKMVFFPKSFFNFSDKNFSSTIQKLILFFLSIPFSSLKFCFSNSFPVRIKALLFSKFKFRF